MLLFADQFLADFQQYRVAWLAGQPGSGKTLAAFAIAAEFHKRKMIAGIVSNCKWYRDKCPVPAHPWREDGKLGVTRFMRESAIIFDEAWTVVDNRTSLQNNRSYGAFSRKFDCYWLVPSVIPVDKRLAYMKVQRAYRLSIPVARQLVSLLCLVPHMRSVLGPLAALGEEIWVYHYKVELDTVVTQGKFWIVNPSHYYGWYDTLYAATDDGDISFLWERTLLEDKKNDAKAGKWYIDKSQVQHGSEPGLGDNTAKVRGISSRLSELWGPAEKGA